jgi:isoleucyl-tRNA synthetase
MRKDLDLDLEERIRLAVAIEDDRVADLVSEHRDLIESEVRAAEFVDLEEFADPDGSTGGRREKWEIEGVDVTIAVEPLREATA